MDYVLAVYNGFVERADFEPEVEEWMSDGLMDCETSASQLEGGPKTGQFLAPSTANNRQQDAYVFWMRWT